MKNAAPWVARLVSRKILDERLRTEPGNAMYRRMSDYLAGLEAAEPNPMAQKFF
jgi:hypothetical protein